MTSISVCKKTSSTRKRYMIDENFLWNTVGKPSVINNCVLRPLADKAPRRQFWLARNIIISATVHDRGNVSIEHLHKVGVTRSNSINENCIQRPLEEIC